MPPFLAAFKAALNLLISINMLTRACDTPLAAAADSSGAGGTRTHDLRFRKPSIATGPVSGFECRQGVWLMLAKAVRTA